MTNLLEHKHLMKIRDRHHLMAVIEDTITIHGRFCDFNHLDVSDVTDMSTLFLNSNFDGDISGLKQCLKNLFKSIHFMIKHLCIRHRNASIKYGHYISERYYEHNVLVSRRGIEACGEIMRSP